MFLPLADSIRTHVRADEGDTHSEMESRACAWVSVMVAVAVAVLSSLLLLFVFLLILLLLLFLSSLSCLCCERCSFRALAVLACNAGRIPGTITNIIRLGIVSVHYQ